LLVEVLSHDHYGWQGCRISCSSSCSDYLGVAALKHKLESVFSVADGTGRVVWLVHPGVHGFARGVEVFTYWNATLAQSYDSVQPHFLPADVLLPTAGIDVKISPQNIFE
jgi:hypothetical protein